MVKIFILFLFYFKCDEKAVTGGLRASKLQILFMFKKDDSHVKNYMGAKMDALTSIRRQFPLFSES